MDIWNSEMLDIKSLWNYQPGKINTSDPISKQCRHFHIQLDTFTHTYYRPLFKKELHTESRVCSVLKDAWIFQLQMPSFSPMFIFATLFSPLLPWICYSYGNWRSLWMASGFTAKYSLNLSLPIPFKLTDKLYQQNS